MGMMIGLMCMSIACLTILMSNPQSIVMLLVIQTFLCSLLLSITSSVWYFYILFLVFLGGMLVIFVYISSLSVNVKIEDSYTGLKQTMMCFLVLGLVLSYLSLNNTMVNPDTFFYSEESVVNFLLSYWNFILYLIVISYLLMVLYNICYFLKVFKGPLRKFN